MAQYIYWFLLFKKKFFFYHIKGDNVFLPVGNDFGFRNAEKNFKNLDKLINYYNSHPELNVTAFYSTPKLFFEYFLKGLQNPSLLKTK